MGGWDLTTVRKVLEPSRGALAMMILTLGLSHAAAQALDRSSLPSQTGEHRRFIVAFALRADRAEEFVWPHRTFPAAKYARVLLVVDEMPRVRAGGSTGRLEALSATEHLRINGRLREPRKAAAQSPATGSEITQEEFVVELSAGRLRLSLLVPRGVELDAQYESARITLYELESPAPQEPPERGSAPNAQ